jgi:hypothetical protein
MPDQSWEVYDLPPRIKSNKRYQKLALTFWYLKKVKVIFSQILPVTRIRIRLFEGSQVCPNKSNIKMKIRGIIYGILAEKPLPVSLCQPQISQGLTHCIEIWENREPLLYPMLSDFRKNIVFWKVPRLRPLVLLRKARVDCVLDHVLDDTDRGKSKYCEINLSQFDFVHHKSQKDWAGYWNVNVM